MAPPGLQLGRWLNDHPIAVTAPYGTLNDATCGTGPAIVDTAAGTIGIIREHLATPDCAHGARVQFLLWAGPIPPSQSSVLEPQRTK
jgi:hypothetical protein